MWVDIAMIIGGIPHCSIGTEDRMRRSVSVGQGTSDINTYLQSETVIYQVKGVGVILSLKMRFDAGGRGKTPGLPIERMFAARDWAHSPVRGRHYCPQLVDWTPLPNLGLFD